MLETSMRLKDFDQKNAVCEVCKGKPDEAYFRKLDNDEIEILSVICKPCKEAYEATIRSIGRGFCDDPNCKECEG